MIQRYKNNQQIPLTLLTFKQLCAFFLFHYDYDHQYHQDCILSNIIQDFSPVMHTNKKYCVGDFLKQLQ